MQSRLVSVLKNGIKIIALHDASAVRTACAIKINAGSFHEPIQWPGLAHYLEHCLFLGSLVEETPFAQHIQKLGGRYNAKTLSSHTLYFADVPAAKITHLLRALVALVTQPAFDEQKTLAEITILDAEYQARCADEQQQALNAVFEHLNPAHPLSRFYAGCAATLAHNPAQLLAALIAWHAEHYVAQRMSVFISGPQTAAFMLDAAERHFSGISAGYPAKARPSVPLYTAKNNLLFNTVQKKAALHLLWPVSIPQHIDTDSWLSVLNYLITQNDSDTLLAALNDITSIEAVNFRWIEASAEQGLLHLVIKMPHFAENSSVANIIGLCTHWLFDLSHNPTRWPDIHTERAILAHAARLNEQLPDFERAAVQLAQYEKNFSVAEVFPYLADIIKSPSFIIATQSEALKEGRYSRWFPVNYAVRPVSLAAMDVNWPPYRIDYFWQCVVAPAIQNHAHSIPGLYHHQSVSWIYWPNLAVGQAEQLETELAQYWQQHFNKGRIWGVDYVALSRPSLLRFVVIAPHAVLPAIMAALWQTVASRMANNSAHHAVFVAPSSPWLLRRILYEPSARWITWPVEHHEEQQASHTTEAGQQAVLLRVFALFQDARLEAIWRVLGTHWAHAFYQQLRVEQGLGYALFCRFERSEEAFELQFALQSPSVSVLALQTAIRCFVQRALDDLAHLTPAAFAELQAAAVLELQDGGRGMVQFKRYCLTQWAAWPRGWDEDVLFNLQTLNLDTLRQQARTLLASETSSVYWRWLVSDGSPR